MTSEPYVYANRRKGWSGLLQPSVRWFCVYGIPTGTRDGVLTYTAATRHGTTRRRAIASARSAAEARMTAQAPSA